MWQGRQPHPQHSKNLPSYIEPSSDGTNLTFKDKERGILGCEHYQRQCKLQANCCQKIYSCRFCHDDAEDHNIVRTDTEFMFCMHCQTIQPAAQVCEGCQRSTAHYYCDKCKLWDDDTTKDIFHCDACGICRQGLPNDFFHCDKCNICMSISMQNAHRCIERNLESDCPICGEYMFTSTTAVIFMKCGHCIHRACHNDYIQTSYQCPTCLKSLFDMSEYFRRLDRELERQSMPTEYQKFVSVIFCNDCEQKSCAKYHFFYHKCKRCLSYNTTVLRTESNTSDADSTASSSSPPLLTSQEDLNDTESS
ncbi:zf-CHY-domain-containing protein [Hesseltinella vesiculosa]|uniref:Zf-CHY-domain-containing protein n=1 Tax=Hesseltinella vesiculosa TaxID=101127 RepID=A0A1X2G280_9FUNG|nr:zf-CHY-domain-containing protein [Hesseltinella vesiculosa]